MPRAAPPDRSAIQGTCQVDPCVGKQCGPDEFCQQGKCVPVCEAVFCAQGETCKTVVSGGQILSQCVKDPCHGMSCLTDQVCLNGKCVTDPCAGQRCPNGQVCVEGSCVQDLCEGMHCPAGFECRATSCQLQNVESTTEILASGSGAAELRFPQRRRPHERIGIAARTDLGLAAARAIAARAERLE